MQTCLRLLLCLAVPMVISACEGGDGASEDPPPAGEHFPGVDQPSAAPST